MEYLILKLKLITKLIKLIQQFKSIKSMNIFKLNLYHIYFQVSYFLWLLILNSYSFYIWVSVY